MLVSLTPLTCGRSAADTATAESRLQTPDKSTALAAPPENRGRSALPDRPVQLFSDIDRQIHPSQETTPVATATPGHISTKRAGDVSPPMRPSHSTR